MSDEIDFEQPQKRPAFLTTLCVLSFVSIGFSLLSGLISIVSGPTSEEQMLDQRVEMMGAISDLKITGMDWAVDMMEKSMLMAEDFNNNFYLATILNLIIVLTGLFGVLRMLSGYKMGFHIYIVYCILSVGALYAYVNPAHIPSFVIIVNVILSGLFVFLYSRNLKWMIK